VGRHPHRFRNAYDQTEIALNEFFKGILVASGNSGGKYGFFLSGYKRDFADGIEIERKAFIVVGNSHGGTSVCSSRRNNLQEVCQKLRSIEKIN
jgi:hypothetical protein